MWHTWHTWHILTYMFAYMKCSNFYIFCLYVMHVAYMSTCITYMSTCIAYMLTYIRHIWKLHISHICFLQDLTYIGIYVYIYFASICRIHVSSVWVTIQGCSMSNSNNQLGNRSKILGFDNPRGGTYIAKTLYVTSELHFPT